MYKSIKVRLYPTVKQKQMLDRHFDGYRFAYNLCLEYKSFMWKHYKISVSGYDMDRELRLIRNETPWLLECRSDCVTKAALNVDDSFKKFFKGSGYPKFKTKRGTKYFYAKDNLRSVNGCISFKGNLIKIATSNDKLSELTKSKIKNASFSRDLCGDYFAACIVECDINELPKIEKSIGVDLGLKDLLVTSDGTKYPNNRYMQSTAFKIAKFQRRFARSQKGSSNRNKLRIKIAKLHRKATRQREHYYHQITNELIRDNQTIVLETLKVKNMLKNRRLSKGISDASWGTLIRQFDYKAKMSGRTIVRIGTFYPSTKTCSTCGLIKDIRLWERTYNCSCGMSLDRDINAAINIRNLGMKIPFKPVEISGCAIGEAGSNNTTILN